MAEIHTSAPRKSVYVPDVGDYMTDGERLVEVRRQVRLGWDVLDVLEPDDRIPEQTFLLRTQEVVWHWRKVEADNSAG